MADPSFLSIPRIPMNDDPQSGTDAATDWRTLERWARYLRDSIWPVGMIREIATPDPNPDWLICNGAAVPRLQYVTLFNKIGTRYGAGDGTTTFNIPDFRGRVPMGAGIASGGTVNRVLGSKVGAETTTLTVGNMPPHVHDTTHAPTIVEAAGFGVAASPSFTDRVRIDHTPGDNTGSAGSATPVTTTPPATVVNFEIRAV